MLGCGLATHRAGHQLHRSGSSPPPGDRHLLTFRRPRLGRVNVSNSPGSIAHDLLPSLLALSRPEVIHLRTVAGLTPYLAATSAVDSIAPLYLALFAISLAKRENACLDNCS